MAFRFANGQGKLSEKVREQQDLVSMRSQVEHQIVVTKTLPGDRRDVNTEMALIDQLRGIDAKLKDVSFELNNDFSSYTQALFPEPQSLTDVKRELRSDERLVQFSFTRTGAFAWLIGGEHPPRWVRLRETPNEITAKVFALRCGLDRTAWRVDGHHECLAAVQAPRALSGEELPPFNLAIAHELYEVLFEKLRDEIENRHLLVVLPDALASLPLHVLVTKKPASAFPATPQGYADTAWLAKANAITVLPSVASLKALRRSAGASSAPRPYIAFANPLLVGPNGTDRRAWRTRACPRTIIQRITETIWMGPSAPLFRDGAGDVEALRRLPPLPGTADAVCAIARKFGASSLVQLGAEATEGTIRELNSTGALKMFRILHFATHGLLASDTRKVAHGLLEPALVLTPPQRPTQKDDGLLLASEVAELKLNADWVILSACNTAGSDGRQLHGSGGALSGLARAFFYAGARSLLVSHWDVDLDAGVKIAIRVVSEMQSGGTIGRSEALRRAMVAQMNDKSRPPHWPSLSTPEHLGSLYARRG